MLTIRLMLLAVGMLAMSGAALAQFGVSVSFGPPELPVYEQPICPGDGYIWTPGYWAYGDESDGYYWVPGTWVEAPQVGYLWTPGYWGWGGNAFLFHQGYWGTEVGFYGGVNYGFGYSGRGYDGGRWDNGHFDYNRSYSNVNVSVNRNVYNEGGGNNRSGSRVSFNGGNGGINERPDAREEAAGNQRHVGPVAAQTSHAEAARGNPELRASSNQGKPPIAATARPGGFKDNGAVPAREGGAVHSPPATSSNNSNRPVYETARPTPAVHAKDLPPAEHMAAPNTGNAKTDQRYQQQQQKLQTQQVKERQTLQTRQEQDHSRLAQKPANQPQQQQLEQRHAQQTTQLEQKHTQQQQQLQQHQQPAQHASPPKQGKGNG